MSTIPLFWDPKFATFLEFNLAEVVISSGRKFVVNFEESDSKIRIPGRLTFGGFFPLDEKAITQKEFVEIMERFTSEVTFGRGLLWKLPPDYFYTDLFSAQKQLGNFSSLSQLIDVNQHIELPNWNFKKMSKGNQKKYRQATEASIVHRQGTIEDISKCYSVLSQNRTAIAAKVSMSEAEILKSMKEFPGNYRIDYLELTGEVVAMCFTIDIAPKIRYVLYWADSLKFRNYSPVVLLCERIIQQAINDKIEVLDLGISSVAGELDQGLYRFKENLGAISSSKRTLFQ